MTKRFVFNITDEQHARLEEHRQAMGLRSMADVVRWWVSMPPGWISKQEPAAEPVGAQNVAKLVDLRPTRATPGSRLKNR